LGDLGALHSLLIEPVAAHIGARSLRIVVDGELASVPFAALWNRRTRRFLVQDHVVSLTSTVSDAARASGAGALGGRAVIVASPTLAGSRFSRLPTLRGADKEASAIAALYPRATSLRGADADSAQFVAALQYAGIVHFAGHAILDDAQPWRSVLALRPRGLSAASIAALDLHRVQLVVLSACETMRAPSGEAAGFEGLADAFIGAGAGGVVASLWRVNDDDTVPLMAAFHRAYRASGDAAAALRESQLALIGRHRPPAAWAAFSYQSR
jgi:CHAT domain-containing protein